MKSVEQQLREYGRNSRINVGEEEKKTVLERSKAAFYRELENRPATRFEFIFQQSRFLQKRWWLIQFLVLVLAYVILRCSGGMVKELTAFGALFIILVIPELWKNKSQASMEIEGAAYYSLRQIYAARLLLFGVLDGILLSVFSFFVVYTTRIELAEMVFQFFLPMIVTCCICFTMLCSTAASSELAAVFLSAFWTAVWMLLISQESVYRAVSVPIWTGICVLALLYLAAVIDRVLRTSEQFLEKVKTEA